MGSSYKEEKEGFVSGGEGCSGSEILGLLTNFLVSPFIVLADEVKSAKAIGTSSAISYTFMSLVLPLLAIITILSKQLWILNLLLGVLIIVASSSTSPKAQDSPSQSIQPTLRWFHQPFLTVYWAQLILLTALLILAADFKIFPRKFAKTESWGISLIIFFFENHNKDTVIDYKILVIHLGNFLCRLFPFLAWFDIRPSDLESNLINQTPTSLDRSMDKHLKNHPSIHLSFLGVQEYVLSSSTEQTIFVSPNREGLASLMGKKRGLEIWSPQLEKLTKSGHQVTFSASLERQTGKVLVIYSKEERVPITLEIINQNSLAIFLFANLLTGIINLSVHSMYINPVPAFSILQLYSACIVAFAYLIRNIKISL
ncbi:hypothetical protein MJO29_002932 [Puccinia striiformis f. sp. tritici]|nr:hypothetical protein MJO29_002932 [Puccinia striiformis f. sp. tritici]